MPTDETILLIGDARDEMRQAVGDACPEARVTSVASVFDGIAALTGGAHGSTGFTTVLAAAEPIERRPEAAVRTLRELAGDSRLVLFGHSTLELLSRKMLKFGCDDYVVTPAGPAELRQALLAPNHRLAVEPPEPAAAPAADGRSNGSVAAVPSAHPSDDALARSMVTPAGALDLAAVHDVLLEGLIQQPHNPIGWTLRLASTRLAPAVELLYRPAGEGAPAVTGGRELVSVPVTTPDGPGGALHALINYDADDAAVRDLLAKLAGPVGKVAALQARHAALQKMAITDELTGVYNARYFRHFLQRILEKARQMHFPVTLLLFDIDDFKTYNDQFGHGVGDEILKQTAAMMKRCTREHDLVARIGGDEFAVVFWDKEGPRQPREPRPGNVSRPPQSPVQVFERFKRMIQSDDFTALGTHGVGKLGISAGLAVYPYEGHDVPTLIAEAD
ncbi:MAG TPA: GGDEF domain-containing protein, partial [Humisphaera sp.]